MFKELIQQSRPALVGIVVFTILTGALYPALVTVIAQTVFPKQAQGSFIEKDGKPIGSDLIGQPFSEPKYFWGRISGTSPKPYDASSSNASNLGPTNPALAEKDDSEVKSRIKALKDADPENTLPIPVDLVTSSGSGLDPHISPAAAEYQVRRVAKTRSMTAEAVEALVKQCTENRELGVLGEPRVNVLKLNLALDAARAP
jgi:K+-transporting ATPase ATPase C chain